MQERKRAETAVQNDEKLARLLNDLEGYFLLAHEETNAAERENLLAEIEGELTAAESWIGELETSTLLSGENDRLNAIVTIKPGAGGIDSQDWAEMLLRMYRAGQNGTGSAPRCSTARRVKRRGSRMRRC